MKALRRSVLQEDDISCELHVGIHSDVSDYSDNEIVDSDSDSDVPTTSSHKQLRSSAVVVTGDRETSTEEEESSELKNSDDRTSDVWHETDKKPMSLSLEPQV